MMKYEYKQTSKKYVKTQKVVKIRPRFLTIEMKHAKKTCYIFLKNQPLQASNQIIAHILQMNIERCWEIQIRVGKNSSLLQSFHCSYEAHCNESLQSKFPSATLLGTDGCTASNHILGLGDYCCLVVGGAPKQKFIPTSEYSTGISQNKASI